VWTATTQHSRRNTDDHGLDSYTFTEQDQFDAAQIFQWIARRPISKRKSDYSSFPVRLDGRWAAVQIIITPSLHPQLANQAIFSLHYRYGLSCESISGDIADERVRQTVQYIVDAYFLLFERTLWIRIGKLSHTSPPESALTSNSNTKDPACSLHTTGVSPRVRSIARVAQSQFTLMHKLLHSKKGDVFIARIEEITGFPWL